MVFDRRLGTVRVLTVTSVVDDDCALVAEAKWAFEGHRKLFDELALTCGVEA